MTAASNRTAHRLTALAVGALVALTPGCATIAGTATGAVTGMVDLPHQFYTQHKKRLDDSPEWWGPTVLIFAPIGLVAGPVMGFFKGASLDIQAGIQDIHPYGTVWTTYDERSVWRPWTFE